MPGEMALEGLPMQLMPQQQQQQQMVLPGGSTSSTSSTSASAGAGHRTMAVSWVTGTVGQLLHDQGRGRQQAAQEREGAQRLADRLLGVAERFAKMDEAEAEPRAAEAPRAATRREGATILTVPEWGSLDPSIRAALRQEGKRRRQKARRSKAAASKSGANATLGSTTSIGTEPGSLPIMPGPHRPCLGPLPRWAQLVESSSCAACPGSCSTPASSACGGPSSALPRRIPSTVVGMGTGSLCSPSRYSSASALPQPAAGMGTAPARGRMARTLDGQIARSTKGSRDRR